MFRVMLGRPRVVILLGMVLVIGGGLMAQPTVVPLMGGATTAEGLGDEISREGSARRAMELGFSSVAAGIWESLIAEETDADRRDELLLSWTIALLEDDRPVEAAEALMQLSDGVSSRARLRAGLVAFAQGNSVAAGQALGTVDQSFLPASEVSWFHYLNGALAHEREDFTEAREGFAAAITAATSGLQEARFELADLRTSWRESEPTEEQAATLLRRMDEYAGEQVGLDAAKRYAAVLAALGRGPESVTFLQNRLLTLPPAERGPVSYTHLTLPTICSV